MPPCLAGPSAAEPLVRRQTTKSTKGNLPHVPIPPRSSPDGPRHLARRSVRPGSLYRSEDHTSELQSRQYLVCRLLLEKKKKQHRKPHRMKYVYPELPSSVCSRNK